MSVQEPLIETKRYPALRFLVAYGKALALLLGLVPVLAGAAAVWIGFGWIWVAAGLAVGLLAWLLLRSYVELLTIIADTLLPQ